ARQESVPERALRAAVLRWGRRTVALHGERECCCARRGHHGPARRCRTMTYQPDLYDLVTPGAFQGDVEWYCNLARASGGPVLELGAGTGRVTLAIASSGVAIHALDSDPAMLQRLRAKLATQRPDVQARVSVVSGDMRAFDLDERFALIICPFRSFLH